MCAQPIERSDVPEIAAWTRHCEVERGKWREVAVSHGADSGLPEACKKIIHRCLFLWCLSDPADIALPWRLAAPANRRRHQARPR